MYIYICIYIHEIIFIYRNLSNKEYRENVKPYCFFMIHKPIL